MTRTSRALHIAYGTLFTWLTYCTAISARHEAWWTASAFTAGTALTLTAAWREGLLQDAAERETATRPPDIRLAPAERRTFRKISDAFGKEPA